jgi:hypothetical protein
VGPGRDVSLRARAGLPAGRRQGLLAQQPQRGALALSVAIVALCGCASLPTGTFAAQGFTGPSDGYQIDYASPADANRDLLPGWRVETFAYAKGRPAHVKSVARRTSTVPWADGDGEPMLVDAFDHDLELRHPGGRAVIWVGTLPRDPTGSPRLEVFARISTRAAQAHGPDWALDDRGGRPRVEVIAQHPVEIDGLPARQILLDVASPAARKRRLTVVFVKPPVPKALRGPTEVFDVAACLYIGYANDAADFDALRGDFESLLARVRVPHLETAPAPLVAGVAHQRRRDGQKGHVAQEREPGDRPAARAEAAAIDVDVAKVGRAHGDRE